MKRSCKHTPLWREGKKCCRLCGKIPKQWKASARAASANALQWLRERGFIQ